VRKRGGGRRASLVQRDERREIWFAGRSSNGKKSSNKKFCERVGPARSFERPLVCFRRVIPSRIRILIEKKNLKIDHDTPEQDRPRFQSQQRQKQQHQLRWHPICMISRTSRRRFSTFLSSLLLTRNTVQRHPSQKDVRRNCPYCRTTNNNWEGWCDSAPRVGAAGVARKELPASTRYCCALLLRGEPVRRKRRTQVPCR